MVETGEIKQPVDLLIEGRLLLMNYKNEILSVLENDKVLGFKTLTNKTILINKTDETGVENWIHHIFHPLQVSEIDFLEKMSKRIFPESYRIFLTQCNGVFLFGGNFYIYGKAFFKKGMSRDEMLYQPYDLIQESEDPPCKIPVELFYFGGTPETVFALNLDGSVLELKRRSGKPVSRSDSFDIWLIEKLNSTTVF